MSKSTKIQWCDSTCNPTMGCDGCELWTLNRKSCYAGIMHVRFGGVTKGYATTFEQVTEFPDRMAEAATWSDLAGRQRPVKPWLDGLPRLVFISDMSDALSAAVSFKYLQEEIVTAVMSAAGRRHQWLWLTKRPERMAQFSTWLLDQGIEWPKNLWPGTSITTQGTSGRVNSLLKVGDPKTIRFVSVEPQVEPIDLEEYLPDLDWVIQGGESGRQARPFEMEWAADLIEQCQHFGVPYFLKQLGSVALRAGKRVAYEDNHAGDWEEWPGAIRVRQMPAIG